METSLPSCAVQVHVSSVKSFIYWSEEQLKDFKGTKLQEWNVMVLIINERSRTIWRKSKTSIWVNEKHSTCCRSKTNIVCTCKKKFNDSASEIEGPRLWTRVYNDILLCKSFVYVLFLFFCLFHSVNSCLVTPSKQTWCINIWMCVIFIIWYLEKELIKKIFLRENKKTQLSKILRTNSYKNM